MTTPFLEADRVALNAERSFINLLEARGRRLRAVAEEFDRLVLAAKNVPDSYAGMIGVAAAAVSTTTDNLFNMDLAQLVHHADYAQRMRAEANKLAAEEKAANA